MSVTLDVNRQEVTLSDDERQLCEVWTRVMGYHRPVASFNIGKQGEHEGRLSFVVCNSPEA
jgi:anaerobic ribonucleoside-triphosphate reductase